MTVAANIVIADAQATPVNHTFVPIGKDDAGVFWFVDQSQANSIGYWRVSVKIQEPSAPKAGEDSSKRTRRVTIGLHEPILETVSNNTVSGIPPAPTVSYIPRCISEYVLPERASLQNRKDLRKMSYLLQNDANVIAVVENGQYLV